MLTPKARTTLSRGLLPAASERLRSFFERHQQGLGFAPRVPALSDFSSSTVRWEADLQRARRRLTLLSRSFSESAHFSRVPPHSLRESSMSSPAAPDRGPYRHDATAGTGCRRNVRGPFPFWRQGLQRTAGDVDAILGLVRSTTSACAVGADRFIDQMPLHRVVKNGCVQVQRPDRLVFPILHSLSSASLPLRALLLRLRIWNDRITSMGCPAAPGTEPRTSQQVLLAIDPNNRESSWPSPGR